MTYLEYLPICQNYVEVPDYIKKTEFTDKTEFLRVLQEILSSDCWALVLNGEVIWNDYIEQLNYKQKLYQSMIRDYTINNPQSIINMLNQKELNILDIYMFGTVPMLYKVFILGGKYQFTFYN
jgi:hypothetical protein